MNNWHQAIINDATQKLGRNLTEQERRFITSHGGYIALEIIMDTVRAKSGEDLERYLNSENDNLLPNPPGQ